MFLHIQSKYRENGIVRLRVIALSTSLDNAEIFSQTAGPVNMPTNRIALL
jgi:hypothetical protein